MKTSDLIDALRESIPDAEVVTCLKVPDGEGDYLLFGERPVSFAEPYPGDDGRFLVHATVTFTCACPTTALPPLRSLLQRPRGGLREHGQACRENDS